MKDWRLTLIGTGASIHDALGVINRSALQVALVVDGQERLLGMITDGDIRRGILANLPMTGAVEALMQKKCTVASPDDSPEKILQLMRNKSISHVPVVDDAGCVKGLKVLHDLLGSIQQDNWVVLMAGGMGTRLRPLTQDCPKPLLKVGGRPLLETIIRNFMKYGFHRFFIAINYKGDMIEEYFGDGDRLGCDIRYLREDRQLGTAGALHLLAPEPDKPVIVMNGDVLTQINMRRLLEFHGEQEAVATMCVREYDFQVPFGVVKADGHRLLELEEKPVHSFFVNAGIYVLEPSCLKDIPSQTYFDMPMLFEKVMARDGKTVIFPIHEYWMDIGQLADYERANGEYRHYFA